MNGCVWRFAFVVSIAGGGVSRPAFGQTYLDRIARDFSWPVYVRSPPNDPSRLFVAESNTGQIKIVDANTRVTQPTPFLTITDLPAAPFAEQGLLGVAFDPNFATNG